MNNKRINILPALILAFSVTACTSPSPSGSGVSLEKFNSEIKNKIINNHNYTARVFGQYNEYQETLADYHVYNINNDVLYDDAPTYKQGYIRQKDQGVVSFYMIDSMMVVGSFISTNPTIGMSELYPYNLETVLGASFSKDESKSNTFKASNRDSIAVIGYLVFGEYIIYSEAPENNEFTVSVQEDLSSFTINANFTYNYVSTASGSVSDSFVKTPVKIEITVNNIGSTHDSDYEGYVSNPSYVYPTPTRWSVDDASVFNVYFGKTTPTFPTGLSYSYECEETLVEGKYYAGVVDYASGNLSSSYGAVLVNEGYLLTDGVYVKTVNDSTAGIKKLFKIKMNFISPDTRYSEGVTYGKYYPNGVFSILYRYEEETTIVVSNVAQLNQYIAGLDASKVLPSLPLSGDIRVSGFKNGTAASNQNSGYDYDVWSFTAPGTTSYFKVYIPTYAEAVNFIQAYGSSLEEVGFVKSGQLGSFPFGSWTDDYNSRFMFGDPVFAGEANYPGYVQIQLAVSIASVEHSEEVPAQEHSISVVNPTGATITITSHASLAAKRGETITFRVALELGYTLNGVSVKCGSDNVTVSGPNIISGAYSFVMPDGDVTVTASVSSSQHQVVLESLTVVDPKTEYTVGDRFEEPKVKGNYSDGNTVIVSASFSGYNMSKAGTYTVTVSYDGVSTTYQITVKDGGGTQDETVYNLVVGSANTYSLIFKDNGTGIYRRTNITSSGTTIYEAYFSYRISGTSVSVTLTGFATDCTYTNFASGYRLFSDSSYTTNDTGVVNSDGSITFTLYNYDHSKGTAYTFVKE